MTEFTEYPYPITPLIGLNILITGCNRGIGLGLVKRLLNVHGTTVVGTCRNPEEAVEIKQLVEEYGSKRLVILRLNTTSMHELEELRKTIRSHGIEHLDIIIANAGVGSKNHPFDPAMGSPEDDMMNTFRTNTLGTVFTVQAMAPLISMSKRGKLFLTMSGRQASIEETAGVGGLMSFRMSKAAMNMACMTLAQDPTLASYGVRVLCMDPGNVATRFVSPPPVSPPPALPVRWYRSEHVSIPCPCLISVGMSVVMVGVNGWGGGVCGGFAYVCGGYGGGGGGTCLCVAWWVW